MHLVLASSSRYRRELLARLNLPFEAASPDIDESASSGETPTALVQRLSLEKAAALRTRFSHHLIIGSDQVAVCDGAVLTKPGTAERAQEQLRQQSGRTVEFLTGLALLNSESGVHHLDIAVTRVTFRTLSEAEIVRYVAREKPLECAGSFRSEALGISLFESVASDDPTALIGLPLVRLCDMLRKEGVRLP